MKNKVVVTIAGREYTMVAVEDEAYVRKCAALVDQQLKPILSGRLSQADGAVLAACQARGVLPLRAKNKVRLLPPLNIPQNLLAQGVQILKEVCAE